MIRYIKRFCDKEIGFIYNCHYTNFNKHYNHNHIEEVLADTINQHRNNIRDIQIDINNIFVRLDKLTNNKKCYQETINKQETITNQEIIKQIQRDINNINFNVRKISNKTNIGYYSLLITFTNEFKKINTRVDTIKSDVDYLMAKQK